jgi:DNA primase small subunit
MDTQSFIQQKFAEFYREKAAAIEAPPSIRQREFGFLIFKGNVMIRHKGFATVDALRSFVKETAPAHAYYSTAYYETPEEKMENKGWLGADLYFDIDADHIETDCGKIHDRWICRDCGFAGKGVTPPKCPSCGSKRFESKTWPCEVCLEATKQEMVKLVSMLTDDFGFSPGEIDVSFSGHRGYHVHVENEAVRELDSAARKEIVDYITGVGLNPALYGLGDTRLGSLSPSSRKGFNEVGWRGRIAKGAYEFLSGAAEEDLRSLGLKEKTASEIVSRKEAILKNWKKGGPWRPVRGMSKDELQAIVKKAVEEESAKIDTVVTTDIHRLIRLPNSLHGKTGWLKILFPMSEMEVFDPLKTAVAFKKGEATIHVEEAPKFRLGDEWFGPFKDERIELPMAAVMFLLCKKAANLVD